MKNGRHEANGSVYWFNDDKLHREDGPAIEWLSGTHVWWKQWWIEGRQLTEEQFNQWLMKKTLNDKLQSMPHKPMIKRPKI